MKLHTHTRKYSVQCVPRKKNCCSHQSAEKEGKKKKVRIRIEFAANHKQACVSSRYSLQLFNNPFHCESAVTYSHISSRLFHYIYVPIFTLAACEMKRSRDLSYTYHF